MRIAGRRTAGVIAVIALLTVSTPSAAIAASKCRAVDVPIALRPGGAADATLSSEVCYPSRPVPGLRRTVQVLVAGTAYGKDYWDFPYRPATYSYVRAANAAGFTTFNFDRLGTGGSSRPHSSQVTFSSNAYSIHQTITRLRAGDVDGVRYDRVVLVGHSMGSLVAWYEAAEYRDVDAVISSGVLHTADGPAVARFVATLYPAAFDPRFAGTISDPGYLTTMPGTRAASFYHLPTADPRAIETDERLKQTATVFEGGDVFAAETPGVLAGTRYPLCSSIGSACEDAGEAFWYGITRRITVPFLGVVGQYDALLCGTAEPNRCADFDRVRQDERAYFRGPTQQCLVTMQVPDTGHNLNLHRHAQSWFALANGWAASAVRPNAPCPVVPASRRRGRRARSTVTDGQSGRGSPEHVPTGLDAAVEVVIADDHADQPGGSDIPRELERFAEAFRGFESCMQACMQD